jgi:hypothetical protein
MSRLLKEKSREQFWPKKGNLHQSSYIAMMLMGHKMASSL